MSMDEKDLKEKFEGYEVAPSSGVWDRIERKLNRKRRRFLWILLPGLIACLGMAAGYWSWDQGAKENGEAATQTTQQSSMSHAHFPHNAVGQNPQAFDSTDAYVLVEEPQNNQNPKTRKGASKPSTNSALSPESHKENESETNPSSIAQKQQAGFEKMALLPAQLVDHAQPPEAQSPDSPEHWVDSIADSVLNIENRKPGKNKWRWGVNLMPQITKSIYQGDGVSDEQLSSMESSEGLGNGFAAELKFYYRFNERLQLLSGVGYAYNQYAYKSGEAVDLHQNKFEYISANSASPDPPPPDNDSSSEQAVKERRDQYHRIGVPVLLRYRLLSDERWHLFAMGGFHANYIIDFDQKYVDGSGEVVSQNNSPSIPVRNLSLHCNLRLGVQYELNENWSLAATPSFKMPLFSAYTDQPLYDKYELSFGLGFGIVKDF